MDLYVFNPDGSELGRSSGSSRQEMVAKRVTQTGTYRLEVRVYGGSGEYVVDVSAGLGSATDQPPTVSFDQPAEGATLSGNATVKVRAADDAGLSKVELAIDGGAYTDITASFDGTFYTYAWNTAGTANGPHTLTVRVTDTASQSAQATRNVTVANQGPEPGLAQELRKTGRVTGAARDVSFTINVHEPGFLDLTLAWTGRADLDFYVFGPDGSQVGRAYTLSNPERLRVDTAKFGTGAYRVRVNLYSGPDTDFTLTAGGFRQESFTGSVSAAAKDSTHQRTMAYTGRGRASLQWSGGSDLDFYLYNPAGQERGRAYTLSNPEVLDTPIDSTGAWSIRVNLYAGAGVSYTLTWIIPEAVLS
ncbi:MAG TPA: Ig-like domain-containing protein [Symbiobacteriaceae bacterium]|nr:Ig-like domain-containing protein [Symbiobacteriaceae bacterium]